MSLNSQDKQANKKNTTFQTKKKLNKSPKMRAFLRKSEKKRKEYSKKKLEQERRG